MNNIRRATREDIPRLVELEEECFALPWSKAAFEQCMEQEYTTFLVREWQGKVIGYLGYQRIVDEVHLLNVAVEEKSRNQGYGKALLEEVLALCDERGLSMTLEVRHDNEPAKKLYFSHGFVEEGRRKNYYGQGSDALILWRRAK